MKRKGTVKNGVVAVDLPDGTEVTIEVEPGASEHRASWGDDESLAEISRYKLDSSGQVVMTPELEAGIRAGEAEADRGEGIPWRDVIAELRRSR
jgi:hypothetical protein